MSAAPITARRPTPDGDIELAGSLWLPAGSPSAVVIMHPGSGPSDRDNDVLFPPIRQALLAAGIAVCSFDKRGVGGSGGDWLTADIHTQATDLAASLAAATTQLPGLPTGLFGHSQGGWVVLEAARLTDPSFVVTNSGPGVTPRLQEAFSTRRQLAARQLPPDVTTAAAAVFDKLMELVGRGEPFEEAGAWLAAPERADAVATLIDVGAFVPTDPRLWQFATTIIDHDPLPALKDVRVPLLALFGADDGVVPVAASVERFRSAVPPELLTVRVLPGGDHRIQTTDEEFVPGYADALVGFVTGVLGERHSAVRSESPTG